MPFVYVVHCTLHLVSFNILPYTNRYIWCDTAANVRSFVCDHPLRLPIPAWLLIPQTEREREEEEGEKMTAYG